MLWRNHPGDDPDAQYQWWNDAASAAQLRQVQRPDAAGPARPGPHRDRRGEAQADLPSRSTSAFASSRSTTCGPTTSDWVVAREEERAGARRAAAARQGRQPAVPLRPPPLLGILPDEVDTRRCGRWRGGWSSWSSSSSSSTLFTFSLLRLFPGDVADAVLPYGTKAAEGSSSATTTGSTSRSSSSTPRGSATSLQGDFGKDYQSNRPVSDKLRDRAPGRRSSSCSTRRSSRWSSRSPSACSPRTAPAPSPTGRINAGAFALLALPELRARARARLLRRGEVATRLTLARPDPGERVRAGLARSGCSAQPTGDLGKHFGTMLLPAIALAAGLIAVYMRLLRSDMIATLQENYITMATAKGLSDRRILWRHALRPSSLTLLTVAGLNFGTLIGGAVAVEVIFQIPGMGTLIYQAINARQIVELQSYIAIIAIGYVLINFAIDSLYVVLDPRIRRARAVPASEADAPTRSSAARRRRRRRGMPVDAGTIEIAAVETGPGDAAAKRRASASRRGCRSRGWRSWSASRSSRRYLPIDDPQGDHHRHRPARPVRRRRHRARSPARRRLQRPRHAVAPALGRSHDAGRRHRSRCSSASCSAACSGSRRLLPRQGRHRRVARARRVPRRSPR